MTEQRLLGANRDFTLLWVGQAVSSLGGGIAGVATPLLVLAATGSPAALGVSVTATMVTMLLVTLPAGAWVDRVDKRHLMQICDLVRGAASLVLAVAAAGDDMSFALILVVSVLSTPFGVLFATAEPATVRHVVPTDLLPLALARNQARGAAAGLCGPPLGGLLFAISPALPFVVDTATFGFSFICVTLIRTPLTAPADARESAFVPAIFDGLKFVWHQAFLRVTLMLIAGLNLVSNALYIAAVVIAERAGHVSSIGLLMTMGGIGGLLGSFVAPALVRRLTVRTILIANRLIWAGLIPLLLVLDHPVWIGAVFSVLFFIGPTGNTALMTRQMALTPTDMQGRLSSASGFVAGIAGPAGALGIGFALDLAGRTAAIMSLATFMLALAGLAAVSRAVRTDGRLPAAAQAGSRPR